MVFQTKKTFLNDLLTGISSSRIKKRLLKTGCVVLLTGLAFITDAHASRGGIDEEQLLFYSLHPDLQRPYQETRQEIKARQALREQEKAFKVINDVISMYRGDVIFNSNIKRYTVEIGPLVTKLNASYTHARKTFRFPHVLRNTREIIYTAMDQGIVSHEAGHMVLHYLCTLKDTPHTGALHEAFGDLTSHFYRFYNSQTRQAFVYGLENGQGCVGDTNFTCTRKSYQSLTLSDVEHNQKLCEVHDFSKTFSTAVYRSMVDAFSNRDANSIDEDVAEKVVEWHKRMLVKAVLSLNYSNPTLMDVAGHMLYVSLLNPKYRDSLGDNFIKNGLIVLLYRNLPTLYNPDPATDYSPNEDFSILCLAEKTHPEKRYILRDSRTN